jgi:IPT/TIG domain
LLATRPDGWSGLKFNGPTGRGATFIYLFITLRAGKLNMSRQWIILGNGDPINLAFVAKVMWGGDFPAATDAQKKRLYLFHGGVASAAANTRGLQSAYDYDTPAAARKAARDIMARLLADGATDLRSLALPTIDSISPATLTTNSGTQTLTLTGTNFTNNGDETVQIGGGSFPVTYVSATEVTVAFDTTNQTGSLPIIYANEIGTATFDSLTVQ